MELLLGTILRFRKPFYIYIFDLVKYLFRLKMLNFNSEKLQFPQNWYRYLLQITIILAVLLIYLNPISEFLEDRNNEGGNKNKRKNSNDQ